MNKIDLVRRESLLGLADQLVREGCFDPVMMISGRTGDGVDDLRRHLAAAVPQGPWLFPEDQLSDIPERLIAAEITREQVFLQLHDELPYGSTVETERWEDRKDGSARIEQVIFVQRPGHRAIVLGEGGQRIKAIGARARAELERMLDRRVHLFLFVKVRENWLEDRERYTALGPRLRRLMQWQDTGFVLAARRHGESAVIVELLTREHGRHAGLVRGGQSPKMRAMLQPGNEVVAIWRGRLDEHLGTIGCELVRAYAARFLDDPGRLTALTSAAALVAAALPEREPQTEIYALFTRLIEALNSGVEWPRQYVKWEQDLLGALGFGLDLTRCAVSGATTDLAYVSPRTGRAVSRTAGQPYHDKLLHLPDFLWRDAPADEGQLALGLNLTGYFLVHHVFAPQNRTLPAARRRLAERMRPAAGAGTIRC